MLSLVKLLESDPRTYLITYLICTAGVILGWLIGILTTPYDAADQKKLENFSKMVGTFLSGYVLSKFDRVLERVINPEHEMSELFALRTLLFFCFFGLSWIVVFVFRQYAD